MVLQSFAWWQLAITIHLHLEKKEQYQGQYHLSSQLLKLISLVVLLLDGSYPNVGSQPNTNHFGRKSKQQRDPLVPLCEIGVCLPQLGGVFPLSMGPTRTTLVTRRSHLSHTHFDKNGIES